MRMNVEVRRHQIVREATILFSEQGFDANTRALAERLGTTQPLLYRYFPSKDLLIEAVLKETFEKHSSKDWVALIVDRKIPLRERLIRFSAEYAEKTYDRTWIRLYMFSGLAGGDFNRRYISTTTEPILRAIASELRADAGVNGRRGRAISQRELEYLWLFHGGLYYVAIRRYIYGLDVDDATLAQLIETSVDSLISGIAKLWS
jgi:AcrR family transcriptional regulator